MHGTTRPSPFPPAPLLPTVAEFRGVASAVEGEEGRDDGPEGVGEGQARDEHREDHAEDGQGLQQARGRVQAFDEVSELLRGRECSRRRRRRSTRRVCADLGRAIPPIVSLAWRGILHPARNVAASWAARTACVPRRWLAPGRPAVARRPWPAPWRGRPSSNGGVSVGAAQAEWVSQRRTTTKACVCP